VPVIYCYLDGLSTWIKRKLAPRRAATGQAAAVSPAK
jgi:hypothetical protein